MEIKQIQIRQQFGQLGLKITQPDLRLQIEQPDLDIRSTPANLDIKTSQPEVIIDLRQSFNSMGLKDIASLMAEEVAKANQTVIKGVERRAQETIELEKAKGPSVLQLADRASKPEQKQLVIGLMPDAPPHITARLGDIKGVYTQGDVHVKLNNGVVAGDFTWGKVEGYLEREPSIDISV